MVSSFGGKPARKVYCEGKQGGLDALLMNALLKPTPLDAHRVEIEPIGGKESWSKFFDVYAQDNDFVAIGDRDCDKSPQFDADGSAKLQQRRTRSQREYLTGLPCIENYFLDARLLHAYIEQKPGVKDVPTVDELEANLRVVADELKFYMAVRWGLAELRNTVRELNRLEDIKAASVVEADCIDLAYKKIEVWNQHYLAHAQSVSTQITTAQFGATYQQHREQFTAQTFFDDRRYLAWFDGKDLMGRWLAKRPRKVTVTMREYCDWAVSRIDFTPFPDLLEFRRICWYEPLK